MVNTVRAPIGSAAPFLVCLDFYNEINTSGCSTGSGSHTRCQKEIYLNYFCNVTRRVDFSLLLLYRFKQSCDIL